MTTNGSEARPLPNGWTWATIGEITQPIEKVKPQDEPQKEFTYLDISGIDNKRNVVAEPKVYYGVDAPSRARQSVKAGDVLFSTVRTYLKNIAQVPDQYDGQVASTGFSILRGEQQISNKYLFYYTLTDTFLTPLGELQRGSSYPAVRDSDVREQLIPLAPFPEQERIVAEIEKQFTRLDQAVASLRRLQSNLARYKASVLKAACEGRLVLQDPNDEPATTLLSRILAERRAQWQAANLGKKYKEPQGVETAELPDLPEGWVWASFDSILREPLRNGHSAKATTDPNGIRTLTLTAVTQGDFSEENTKLTSADPERVKDMWLEPGDILIERSNTPELVGTTRLYKGSKNFAIFPDLIIRARVSKLLSDQYIEIAVRSHKSHTYFKQSAQGISGTMPKISQGTVRSLVLPVPPLAEQERIVAEVERRLSVVIVTEQAITANLARAERLRQAILHRAFTGQLVLQGEVAG